MPLNINCYSHLFFEKNERNKKHQLFIITAFCVNHYITLKKYIYRANSFIF